MEPLRPQSSSSQASSSSSLFQVYLRLRPPLHQQQPAYYSKFAPERYLTVEPPSSLARTGDGPIPETTSDFSSPSRPGTSSDPPPSSLQKLPPTHITVHPPTESRKRAVEKFAFTQVFEEETEQIDLFRGVGVAGVVEGVIGAGSVGGLGRDGVIATLGVTGSGKSHTILGSKSQRGILQLSLDLLYRSLDKNIVHPSRSPSLVASLCATDPSEAQIFSAQTFTENVYGYETTTGPNWSRANTPMSMASTVGAETLLQSSTKPPQRTQGEATKLARSAGPKSQWSILGLDASLAPALAETNENDFSQFERDHRKEPMKEVASQTSPWKPLTPFIPHMSRMKSRLAKLRSPQRKQDTPNVTVFPISVPPTPKRRFPPRPPTQSQPQGPDISHMSVRVAEKTEYTILISMYEVYNDRIFDLLATPTNAKDLRRRHLLFKSTERSPDRKVVAGLRKVVCGTYEEALMVLDTGLQERRVAGTGSNSVSSRSHGFFVVDVKRRTRGGMSSAWHGSTLTIVDLAGSERARNAKTAGATLAEAGKINESLMYLGQCLQMQSDQGHDGNKPTLVPFRQCKLTELLFSNYFTNHQSSQVMPHRNPQKALMIVTADPLGDFNATSQILRYSALAREVTVPRIPSVSSTILAGITGTADGQRSTSAASQSGSPRGTDDSSMVDLAFSEIARLQEDVEILSLKLAEEEQRRREAEANWQHADERADTLEADVREECWTAMEARMAEERRRWVHAWGEETDCNEAHLDRKLDLLSRGMEPGVRVHEDDADREDYLTALKDENEELRRKVQALERDLQCRSPTTAKTTKAASKAMTPAPSSTSSSSSSPTTMTAAAARAVPRSARPPPKLPSLSLGDRLSEGGSGISISIVPDDDDHHPLGGGVSGGRSSNSNSNSNSNSPASFLNSLHGLSPSTTTAARPSPTSHGLGAKVTATMTPGGATKTKVRKLTARKWDLLDENELEEYGVF